MTESDCPADSDSCSTHALDLHMQRPVSCHGVKDGDRLPCPMAGVAVMGITVFVLGTSQRRTIFVAR